MKIASLKYLLLATLIVFNSQISKAACSSSLAMGDRLATGEFLCNGNVKAILQTDGNFVVYNGNAVAGHTGTNGKGGKILQLQWDGNLVLTNASGAPVWNAGTSGRPAHALTLATNGTLSLINLTNNQTCWTLQSRQVRNCGSMTPPPIPGANPQVVGSVRSMFQSSEYLATELRLIVEVLLGRTYDQSLQGNIRPTYNEMVKIIASSTEYFNRTGGKNDLFVKQLFKDLSGRDINTSEFNAYMTVLSKGKASLIDAMLGSQPVRYRRINNCYRRLVKREATVDELSRAFSRNDDIEVMVGIIFSTEYKTLAANRDDV